MLLAYRTEFTDVGAAMSCKPQHWMPEGGLRMQRRRAKPRETQTGVTVRDEGFTGRGLSDEHEDEIDDKANEGQRQKTQCSQPDQDGEEQRDGTGSKVKGSEEKAFGQSLERKKLE